MNHLPHVEDTLRSLYDEVNNEGDGYSRVNARNNKSKPLVRYDKSYIKGLKTFKALKHKMEKS